MTTTARGALVMLLLAATAFAETATPPKKSAPIRIAVVEGQPAQFLFNPTELTIDKHVLWDARVDADRPEVEYGGPTGATVQFAAEFDRTADKGNVYVLDIKPLEGLTLVDSKLKRPPLVKFVWGQFTFDGVIESIGVRYTMFTSDGSPTRATVNVTMREAENARRRNPCTANDSCPSGYECVDSDGDGVGSCVRH
jgi:hypothetical protein